MISARPSRMASANRSSVAVLLVGTSVGGIWRSTWYGSAAAAAAVFTATVRVAAVGSRHSAAIDAMPRSSAPRRVQRSSGGVMLATDPHLPGVGCRAVAHGIDRPQLVRVGAGRERALERPSALLHLAAHGEHVRAGGEADVHGRELGDREADLRAAAESGHAQAADRRRR